MRYRRHYTWGVLLRLFHWAFVLSIIVLVVTGVYIDFPWTQTSIEGDGGLPVATMRYIHFVAGFVFTAAMLARIYLLFFGNKQERIWDFLPVSRKKTGNIFHTAKVYLYVADNHTPRLGHNVIAGISYTITFIMALLQIGAGFYLLYPESSFWQQWGLLLFGPQQQARVIHYLIMWYFIIFAFVHLYMIIWNDIESKEGLISSIFNGRKYTRY